MHLFLVLSLVLGSSQAFLFGGLANLFGGGCNPCAGYQSYGQSYQQPLTYSSYQPSATYQQTYSHPAVYQHGYSQPSAYQQGYSQPAVYQSTYSQVPTSRYQKSYVQTPQAYHSTYEMTESTGYRPTAISSHQGSYHSRPATYSQPHQTYQPTVKEGYIQPAAPVQPYVKPVEVLPQPPYRAQEVEETVPQETIHQPTESTYHNVPKMEYTSPEERVLEITAINTPEEAGY